MLTHSIYSKIKLLGLIMCVLGVLQIGNELSNGYYIHFGISPRNKETWYHIFFAPFIHLSTTHLLNNLIGFSIFGGIVLLSRPISYFLTASLFIIIVSGVLVWLFGRNAVHVGASGWIFGLWSLSIAQAWFSRNVFHFLISIGVLFFYGGMIYGVLPGQKDISFESHLFGAFAGLIFPFFHPLHSRTKKGA